MCLAPSVFFCVLIMMNCCFFWFSSGSGKEKSLEFLTHALTEVMSADLSERKISIEELKLLADGPCWAYGD